MESNTMLLALPMVEAARLLSKTVTEKRHSGTMVDCHELREGERLLGLVMVFERYYLGAGSRLSLTATLEPREDATRLHYVMSGGSGMFGTNGESRAAADKFSKALREALFPYFTGL